MRRLKLLAALPALLRRTRRARAGRPGARSPSATSASRACSASPKARSTTTCRSTSATGFDQRRVEEALRALYATGFFRDVELRRDGGTLVVVVLERPSIESFEIKGNKDIKTEDLEKSLRNVGLARGKTFDRSMLDEVERFLTDQYSQPRQVRRARRHQGRGAARQPRARSRSTSTRASARASARSTSSATRRSTTRTCSSSFELKTPNWLSWYRQDDRYSRESLSGDLEKLRSYYLDRGYANFEIESTQVAIAPEKDDMFITVNVKEGDVYKIAEVKHRRQPSWCRRSSCSALRAGAAGRHLLAADADRHAPS